MVEFLLDFSFAICMRTLNESVFCYFFAFFELNSDLALN